MTYIIFFNFFKYFFKKYLKKIIQKINQDIILYIIKIYIMKTLHNKQSSNMYIINFIVGGLTVLIMSYIIDKYDINMASIFNSLPTTLIIIIFIMWCTGYSNGEISLLGLKNCYTLILLFIFLYVFYFVLDYLKDNKYGIIFALLLSLIMWGIASCIFYHYFKKLL